MEMRSLPRVVNNSVPRASGQVEETAMKQLCLFLLCVTSGSLATFIQPRSVSAQASRPDSCHVTAPNGIVAGSSERNERSHGNTLLSVGPFGLWPNGTVVFKPGGAGFQTKEGALGMKFGWTRGIPGKISVVGHRIDADAPPLRFETNQTNDAQSTGFLASYLLFSTPGCWEVAAQVVDREDSKITFVTRVERIGNGPAWRR
jgi:hypothetical protein